MSEKRRRRLFWGVLAAGILFLAVGLVREEAATVFLKATNICLECIGIG